MTLVIDENIIARKLRFDNSTDVIKEMGTRLTKAGLVNDQFINAVINREKEYPTGLPTKIPVSLCHTDPQYVLKSFLTLATLEKPIAFHEMGNPTVVQNVKIVFVLGVKEKKEQVSVLKNIMNLLHNENLLKSICDSKSTSEIKEILIENIISLSQ
jgi:galactitol PTS system EIIA component